MLEYARRYGIPIKVVRIFNTYGPRMDPEDGRIISSFIVQALRGEPITVFGDGSQTRSFCYVDDLVDGLVKMAASEPSFTGPVNLGSPAEFTVLETASIIKEMTGSSSATVFKALPPDDPRKRKPDISLAESRLGWRPRVPSEQGVAGLSNISEASLDEALLLLSMRLRDLKGRLLQGEPRGGPQAFELHADIRTWNDNPRPYVWTRPQTKSCQHRQPLHQN